ncbi:MAG TPA: nuclear transport factor 2 family protein [Streptosporangiaceae bacterium]|nr:nuclear transport factor 2 family protein [Streptosporangiaceae bacterium]
MSEINAAEKATDRMEIEDLARRYAHGIDARDWDRVDSCFSPTAMVRGTTFSGPYPEYMGSLRGAVESYRTTMHFFGNQLTEVAAGTGHCVTYGIAYHLGSGTGSDFVIGVRYRDDVVREGGRWLISGRVVEGVWRQPLGADVVELSVRPDS